MFKTPFAVLLFTNIIFIRWGVFNCAILAGSARSHIALLPLQRLNRHGDFPQAIFPDVAGSKP
jgi:hypothetical protein